MNIILVEDDLDDRVAFAELVEKINLPISLHYASDSRELFAHLDKFPDVNLIFHDINMPLKNGKQCLKELKLNERHRHIPVLMYTASASQIDIDEVYEYGAHYYIVKPYAYVNMMETMKKIFSIDWTATQPIPSREDFVINMTYN